MPIYIKQGAQNLYFEGSNEQTQKVTNVNICENPATREITRCVLPKTPQVTVWCVHFPEQQPDTSTVGTVVSFVS